MQAKRALIVDDEPDIRELLEITLGRMNLDTNAAPDLATARSLLAANDYDLCLTDLQLPDGDGMDLVAHLAEEQPGLPVAVITAFGSMDAAISALKHGAFDFVQKPVDLEQLRQIVDTALKITPQTTAANSATALIGESAPMERLRKQIAKLARSQAPIYISGESGSGKEVAARLMHEQGPRGDAPFVPVNCGAIPGELMESEFFGHVKGSFTGANSDKEGLFRAATGGTLFLDEVADLPLSMQVKLLRAIQEKAIRSVGAHSEDPIDVRILSATHKDLAQEVAAGRFRQDLFYRLNVIELPIPSLRERAEDILAHTQHILARLAQDYDAPAPKLSDAAVAALRSYSFPGNVRELENILERAFTLCDGDRIDAGDLQLSDGDGAAAAASAATGIATAAPDVAPAAIPAPTSTAEAPADPAEGITLADGVSLETQLEQIERKLITDALEATRWNKTAAAKQLGITFRALRYRLKKLELE
ncbi:MAG: sigma-54 dependent transcriptional regulator [Pseudomonadota bacterium]